MKVTRYKNFRRIMRFFRLNFNIQAPYRVVCDGTFINDGPQMRYGPPERFLSDGGSLLGIYAPL